MLGPTPGDLDGVQLLEAVERPRLHRFASVAMVESGISSALRSADMVVEQLVGVEAVSPLDLRDDAIAAALVDEAVDIAAAEQGAEIARDIAVRLSPMEATLSLSISISTCGRSNFRSLSAK
jgi:hypothetical protein